VGLGDLFVLLFFGLAAVMGSAYVQAGHLIQNNLLPFSFQWHSSFGPWQQFHNISTLQPLTLVASMPLWWWLAAVAIGLQATAIIAVNNLRDISTDALVGKRTLAVRLGDKLTRWYIVLLHALASAAYLGVALMGGGGWLYLAFFVAFAGGMALSYGLQRTQGAALNGYLARSAALELGSGLCLTIGLMLSARHAL
jgi:1,4-dihydroxy-2-naphthoate polyprenyltransferase